MKQSRNLTITDIFHALITIRDRVITDENLTTCKRVIDTMTQLLIDIANGYSNADLTAIESEMMSRGLESEYNLFKEICSHPFVQSLKTKASSITIQGIIDAASFIQTHLKTTVSLFDDLKELLSALEQVSIFKSTNESTRSIIDESARYPEDLREMYTQFIHE